MGLFVSFSTIPVAYGHRVILSVYASGGALEGEVGFSSGDMAARTQVRVSDPDGNEIGKVTTDADGLFGFTPTRAINHIFQVNLGAGHVAESHVPAEDLPGFGGATRSQPPGPIAVTPQAGHSVSADERQLAKLIANEIKPLRREIAAYKEKNNLQTILGGIGYIVGLFGIAFYLAARQRLKKTLS
ncbi:MAG: cobalt ABC transporter permease [Chromatiales bacterium]|nr:cobalt ABC transporter permease [Chromatiales bacterium]